MTLWAAFLTMQVVRSKGWEGTTPNSHTKWQGQPSHTLTLGRYLTCAPTIRVSLAVLSR